MNSWTRNLLIVGLLLLCGCALPPVPSNQPTTSGDAIVPVPFRASGAAVIAPPTEGPVTVPFQVATYDARTVAFRVYHGTNDMQFFESKEVPVGKLFFLTYTHKRGTTDWFRLKAVNAFGEESDFSDPTFWPQLEPDRMTISSSAPTTLQSSSDLKSWTTLGPTPITVLFNQPTQFFRGTGRVTLVTTLSNPLNE